jgi:adenylosuccinate lyase
VSGWAWEVARDLKRLERVREEVSLGNIGGAVGTFSVMGEKGLEIQKLTLDYLGLRTPPISWHSSRDVWAEYAATLAIVASTLGRIANEIMMLQMDEIGELEEPRQSTDVSSSAMPHKRNPIHSETMVTVCNLCWEYEHLVMRGMIVENERDDTNWGNQLMGLQGLCKAVGWMLERSKTTLGGLIVNVDRMKENLDEAGPSIYSEFFVGRLGQAMGARQAHDLLHDVFMKTADAGGSNEVFWHVLSSAKLPRGKVEEWMDPLSAVGLAVKITESTVRVLSRLTSA